MQPVHVIVPEHTSGRFAGSRRLDVYQHAGDVRVSIVTTQFFNGSQPLLYLNHRENLNQKNCPDLEEQQSGPGKEKI